MGPSKAALQRRAQAKISNVRLLIVVMVVFLAMVHLALLVDAWSIFSDMF